MTTATICRTCGFSHPEADCPRWPAREPTAAQTYDTYLLAKAHEFYELKDLTAMKAWMDANNVVIPGADILTVYGYFLGRVQQVAIELARWVERIPEAHRG